MSSDNLAESPQLPKPITPGGFQNNKEALSSLTPSISLNQVLNVQHGPQLFTELHLAETEKMFEEDMDSTGALDMDAFIKVMKKVLRNVSDEMLEALFLKVDSDCIGFVTWQNYMDYMVCEFHGKEEMRKSQYRLRFHLPMTVVPL
ncbi:EF-hand calcium-binding domain-containing protein 8-like [Carlito syrichta]|uniref:EF-hand calcium-binding domain-containing protein 8-like n=1 Tax=Carlito syrichta TaxID=1868482 RepID=A0A1U7UA39_CARSF|nr:EF-hand calcium-binding domain-containing protein 8-like [Carlito syrichta]